MASGAAAAVLCADIASAAPQSAPKTQPTGGTVLRGITWGRSRGYTPLVATAVRYEELHPGVTILWEKPYNFAQGIIEEAASKYDILMIDHPHVGAASESGCLIPLCEHISFEYLKDQLDNSVGKSHKSYNIKGKQWALATDTATPVPFYRPDIFEKKKLELPKTWEDVLELTSMGLVVMDWGNINMLMNFYMMCVTQGGQLFKNDDIVVDEDTGVLVLRQFRELAKKQPENLIDVGSLFEAMTTRDDIAYCPFTYPYAPYSRKGYSKKPVLFSDIVSIGKSGMLKSTLGGAGLAVSSTSPNIETAVDYVAYATSPEIQSTIYAECMGQPGHRKAWLDNHVNELTGNFYKNTLKSHDNSYLRPRYNGYIKFQGEAGFPIRDYVLKGGNEKDVLTKINEFYRESKKAHGAKGVW